MFVYLLIAAELGILYTVFWYLYVREPSSNHKISAQLWGSYEDSAGVEWKAPDGVPCWLPDCQTCSEQRNLLEAVRQEYVLDKTTNHYVQVPEGLSLLDRLATSVDRALTRLNVAP